MVVRWEGVPDCGWRKKKKSDDDDDDDLAVANTQSAYSTLWSRRPISAMPNRHPWYARARAPSSAMTAVIFFFPLVIVVSRAVIVVETKGHTHGYNGWIQHWCGRANRRKTDRATPSLSFHRAKRGNERNRVHKTARNSKCVDSIIQVRP